MSGILLLYCTTYCFMGKKLKFYQHYIIHLFYINNYFTTAAFNTTIGYKMVY
eukprot:UN02161